MIIIPSYNSEKDIEKTLLSAIKLTKSIIVLDNKSSDQTVEIVKKFNIEIIQNIEHVGRIQNWNKVLRLAKERNLKWFKLLFAGDEVLYYNEEQIASLFTKQNIGIIFTDYAIVNNEQITRRSIFTPATTLTKHNCIKKCLDHGNIYGPPSSYIIKTDAINNYFNENFPWCADWLFMATINQAYSSHYLNKIGCTINLSTRKYYSQKKNSASALLEEIKVLNILLSWDFNITNLFKYLNSIKKKTGNYLKKRLKKQQNAI